jgi:hypothetical protein
VCGICVIYQCCILDSPEDPAILRKKEGIEGCGEFKFTESVEEDVLLRLLSGGVFSPHDALHRVESLIERE